MFYSHVFYNLFGKGRITQPSHAAGDSHADIYTTGYYKPHVAPRSLLVPTFYLRGKSQSMNIMHYPIFGGA